MHCFIIQLSALLLINFASGAADTTRCSKIIPQKDTDWAKLTGSWYHLMFIPGGQSFLNCRKMKISRVDTQGQVVYINFDDISSYERNPKFYRDGSVYFKWIAHPGVIYTAINTGMKYKQSYKTFQRRKSLFKNFLGIPSASYTMVSTDYSNYIILTKCGEKGDVQVWVSLKKTAVDGRLTNTIKKQLLSVGIDTSDLSFDASSHCFA